MKPAIVILSVVMGTLLPGAEKNDPFDRSAEAEVDAGNDRTPPSPEEDEMMKAMGEVRLDKGTGKGGPGLIRITVLRSFHAPLVFTWFPGEGEREPSLQAKRAKMETDNMGNRTYTGMDLNVRVKLRPIQDKILKTLWENADFDGLPEECWQPASLDGSRWTYESAWEDGRTMISRTNPINPDIAIEHSPISKQQLLKESNLTTFALMIWTLSGIDEDSIY